MDDPDLLQVDRTSFLASRASFLGREAAKRATKSREVPRHIKSDEGLFWKSVDDQFPDKRTKTWYNIKEKLRISTFFFYPHFKGYLSSWKGSEGKNQDNRN